MTDVATAAPWAGLSREGARDKVGLAWNGLGRSGQAMILGAALFSIAMVMFATAASAYGTCPSRVSAGDATVRMG